MVIMNCTVQNNKGFSLIELLIVIIVIGIAMAVGMQWIGVSIDDYRRIKTEREMAMLATAIVGNSDLHNNGKRSEFGYVGDIGAFPPDLNALYQNPGYATWDGPYILTGFTQDSLGYKTDEWGQVYAYTGAITITSNGSGSAITKKIADASSDYLLNSVGGTITDVDDSLPGIIYRDSIDIKVTIPNGSGGTLSKTYNPDSVGIFTLDSLPVGTHPLDIIYIPNNDTLSRFVTILPRNKSNIDYKFADVNFPSGGGGGSDVEILRPIGLGFSSNLTNVNCANNWQCVDESTSDGDGTYVSGSGAGWNIDLYDTQDHSAGSGTIDSIIVYVKAKGNGGGMKARTAIRSGGSNYTGFQYNTTGSYVDYSTSYLTNPATFAAWTWTDIDNLEIGADLKKVAFCTQAWVEVYYTY